MHCQNMTKNKLKDKRSFPRVDQMKLWISGRSSSPKGSERPACRLAAGLYIVKIHPMNFTAWCDHFLQQQHNLNLQGGAGGPGGIITLHIPCGTAVRCIFPKDASSRLGMTTPLPSPPPHTHKESHTHPSTHTSTHTHTHTLTYIASGPQPS